MTEIRRIDMTTVGDLNTAIQVLCIAMAAGDFKLMATFVQGTELVLIFQKI